MHLKGNNEAIGQIITELLRIITVYDYYRNVVLVIQFALKILV